ncbi:MAG: cellulase family glycosylhydrolase, partial [Solirubrobacteraceae bacterium]|nr:cellulase family glycosylhydrolase [Solirubrobacteraceae bacterium]
TGPEWRSTNGLTQSNISNLKTQWNINIFRLCFNREDYLNNANGVRDKIKNIATWCKDLGIVLILDHQWEWYDGGTVWLPDKQSTINLWNNISQDSVFKNNSYVWFDIWNEPHDCTIAQWRDISNACVQKIRDNGANNICLVAGINWASTIKPWQGNYLPQSNVVYSCHVYYGGGPTSDLDNNIGLVLKDGKDVFIGETAPYWDEPFTSSQVNWFQNTLLPWLDGNNRGSGIPTTKIGFAAWAISSLASASTLTDNDFITPTDPYGKIVKNKLLETPTITPTPPTITPTPPTITPTPPTITPTPPTITPTPPTITPTPPTITPTPPTITPTPPTITPTP